MLALLLAIVAAVAAGAAYWTARSTLQRQQSFEADFARRQKTSDDAATDARSLARQAQDGALAAAAKAALVEARVNEVVVQRGQLDDLIQSLSRSRDESVLVDIETALRVAQQQAAITGSIEPVIAVLRQSDERLVRLGEPRLESVRSAIASDLERMRGVGISDLALLNQRLSDAVRLVDDLPLLTQAARVRQQELETQVSAGTATPKVGAPAASAAAPAASVSGSGASASAPAASSPASRPARAASAAAGASAVAAASALGASAPATSASASRAETTTTDEPDPPAHWTRVQELLAHWGGLVWNELRSLVRVSRVDNADAMLLAPDQAFFIRENLKLRLLNARLSVLSRQFDAAQGDLQASREAITRYFDRESGKVVAMDELLRQVAQQARQTSLPRPDETLSALVAAGGPR